MYSSSQSQTKYEKFILNPRLCYYKPNNNQFNKNFGQEISATLLQTRKSISPKFFYDETGSQLFEEICKLSEYHLTKAETEILESLRKKLLSN